MDELLISTGATRGRGGDADWESPAGAGGDSAGSGPSSHFVFVGPGDEHWLGQRCEVVGAVRQGNAELHEIVLRCGCRVSAPGSWLRRTRLVPCGIPGRR